MKTYFGAYTLLVFRLILVDKFKYKDVRTQNGSVKQVGVMQIRLQQGKSCGKSNTAKPKTTSNIVEALVIA